MATKASHQSVDEYLAAQPIAARAMLKRVRATIRKALPGGIESISYQIPVFKLDGRMVLYFAGFQHHYSIYPATARVVAALKDDLAGLLHSKATLRFSYDDPVPTRLITRIVKLRVLEVSEKSAASKKSKPAARGKRTT